MDICASVPLVGVRLELDEGHARVYIATQYGTWIPLMMLPIDTPMPHLMSIMDSGLRACIEGRGPFTRELGEGT